jgi:hypothetical protein
MLFKQQCDRPRISAMRSLAVWPELCAVGHLIKIHLRDKNMARLRSVIFMNEGGNEGRRW